MSPLHLAAIAGDLPELQRLLSAGGDIDDPNEINGHTPLMAACLSPHAGPEVVEFLLKHGADVHACEHPDPKLRAALKSIHTEVELDPEIRDRMDTEMDAAGIPAEQREMIEQCTQKALNEEPEKRPLIDLAVKKADCAKIRLLLDYGAELDYRSLHGYTLLIGAAYADRMEVVNLLLTSGAPVDDITDNRESLLKILSRNGRFQAIAEALDRGADPTPLEWTPLLRAVALGSLEDVTRLLNEGADPEARDSWERTAFLLSVQTGDTAKAELLLARGANRHATGHCGKPPMQYPVDRDDTRMLQWLMDQDFDPKQTNVFGHTPLLEAADGGASGCFRMLLEASGGDLDLLTEDLISRVTHPDSIRLLHERGADLSQLEASVLRDFIGLGNAPDLPVSAREFTEARTRRFGIANPERMNVPFWNAMVRYGWSGYKAANQFNDDTCDWDNPVWCHQRFGMSLTHLPDGRFIQIAGEHEDFYDPDFCIYNDVIIHDGKGGFEILGYPEDIFPPTDFHSATLVAPWIYIIGNLGYSRSRGIETPVYRWHTETGAMERVTTLGNSPGWIHRHHALLEDGCLRISCGKIFHTGADGKGEITDNDAIHSLDLTAMTWRKLD